MDITLVEQADTLCIVLKNMMTRAVFQSNYKLHNRLEKLYLKAVSRYARRYGKCRKTTILAA